MRHRWQRSSPDLFACAGCGLHKRWRRRPSRTFSGHVFVEEFSPDGCVWREGKPPCRGRA